MGLDCLSQDSIPTSKRAVPYTLRLLVILYRLLLRRIKAIGDVSSGRYLLA